MSRASQPFKINEWGRSFAKKEKSFINGPYTETLSPGSAVPYGLSDNLHRICHGKPFVKGDLAESAGSIKKCCLYRSGQTAVTQIRRLFNSTFRHDCSLRQRILWLHKWQSGAGEEKRQRMQLQDPPIVCHVGKHHMGDGTEGLAV